MELWVFVKNQTMLDRLQRYSLKTILDFAGDRLLHVEARSLLLPDTERSVLPLQPLDSRGHGLLSISPVELQVVALRGSSKRVSTKTSESVFGHTLPFIALLLSHVIYASS